MKEKLEAIKAAAANYAAEERRINREAAEVDLQSCIDDYGIEVTYIEDDAKQEFLDKTREEIQKMIDEDGKQTVENLLTAQNRVIYDSIFEADTYKEFSLLMKVDELSRKLNYVKNKNAKLQKDYDKVKKTNDDLMNSTSWKLTKPLRGIRNIKK